jgi:hypothetical protein
MPLKPYLVQFRLEVCVYHPGFNLAVEEIVRIMGKGAALLLASDLYKLTTKVTDLDAVTIILGRLSWLVSPYLSLVLMWSC